MRVPTVVFDLSGAGGPVTESKYGLPGPSKIPAMDIAVDGTSGEEVRVVGREVDVGDSSAVPL